MERIEGSRLTVKAFTGGEKEGNGIFEELMRTAKSHLSNEFENQRITGAQFTTAYVAMMETSMAQGAAYLLQYELTNQNILLMQKQIEGADLSNELIEAQIAKMEAETLYIQKQTLHMDDLILKTKEDVKLVTEQIAGAIQGTVLAVLQEDVIDGQIDGQLEATKMVIQQTVNALAENTSIIKGQLKTDSEIQILDQKYLTELAQVEDLIQGQPVTGILGRQAKLYENQAEGYIRDAEQKVAKIMSDVFLTRVTTDYDLADAVDAGLSDVETKAVMDIVKAGIAP
jgi:hypothetical protein